jgi:hypothetical protein
LYEVSNLSRTADNVGFCLAHGNWQNYQ